MSKTKYEILSEKQRRVWDLHEQGMNMMDISRKLGVSYNAVRETMKRIDRKFREYDRFQATEEKDKATIFFPLTQGEGKLILEAIRHYEFNLERQNRALNDWRGNIPYKCEVLADLYERGQVAVYGKATEKLLPNRW